MKKTIALLLTFSILFLCGCSINVDALKQNVEALINGIGSASSGNYTFTKENYPRLSTTLTTFPMGEAFTAAALNIPRSKAGDIISSEASTQNCYKALCDKKADIILVYGRNKDIREYIDKTHTEIEMTAVARDALVFICSKDNKTDDLTVKQLKSIYSGDITSWNKVGGLKKEISAYQRIKGSDSYLLFNKLLKLEDKLADVPKIIITDSKNETFESVKDYDNSENALGYTVFYYNTYIDKNSLRSSKILSVDGIMPSAETISDGTYPLVGEIYAVIRKSAEKNSPERILYNWICSQQGSELIKKEKYPVEMIP